MEKILRYEFLCLLLEAEPTRHMLLLDKQSHNTNVYARRVSRLDPRLIISSPTPPLLPNPG